MRSAELVGDGAALLRFLLASALDEELLQAAVDVCNQLAEAGEPVEGVFPARREILTR